MTGVMPSQETLGARNFSRSDELLADHARMVVRRTNRMFAVLFLLQWIGGIVLALVVSPKTWIGAQSMTHVHVWAAVLLGGALSAGPIVCIFRFPDSALTRHVVAAAQMLWSALLIHLSGGRIETHFHVFGSLAFLASYRDWRALMTATVVVAADHLLRSIYWPQSVFGILAPMPWRALEHAGWVVFEDIFLLSSIRSQLQEMREIADRRADLERTNERIETQVRERTAQLQAQTDELLLARSRAEAATQAKSDFLANMSHEIRTPMSAILGYSDVLLDPESSPDDRRSACLTIKRNGGHLLSLINDILDLSKIEAGKLEVERVHCQTRRLLYDVVTLLKGKAEAKGIALRLELEGEVPDRIMSDPTRLKQALVNLAGNAIKFTHEGEVRIVVGCDRESELLRIRIVDQGIGITDDQMSRLFRAFQQADSTTTRQYGGTGLGLAITKRIVDHLGGLIFVDSTPKVGSTFSVILPTGPLEAAQMVSACDPMPTSVDLPVATSDLPTLHGRILLAEDGIDNQRLISMFLRKSGGRVDVAENGRIALDTALAAQAAGEPYSLILMDMQMPELDGYCATRKLRESGYDGQIVALTAHAMKGELDRCLEAGCDHYLSKPIPRDLLVREVAVRMDRKSKNAIAAEAIQC